MQKSTITKSLFLKGESSFVGLSEVVVDALHRIKSQNALDLLARQIIEIGRWARLSRQTDLCNQTSTLLLSLPMSPRLRTVAELYDNLSTSDFRADLSSIRPALISTADNAEAMYVPRIVLMLGRTYDRGDDGEDDLSEAMFCYIEAAKAGARTDPLVAVQAAENVALLRSDDGDHAGALKEMDRLWPIIRSRFHAYPHLYYDYLNNLAVVLSRVGRLEESRQAIRTALSFPLAPSFPEWRQTEREIEEAAKQEPRRRPAALTVVPIPAPGARPREAPPRTAKKSREFVIPGTDIRKVGAFTPLPFPSGLPGVSLLERYVKTVRVRDQP